MPADRFRQELSSTISVPGEGLSGKGRVAAQHVRQVIDALQAGASIRMTAQGVDVTPARDEQWLMVQSAGSTGTPKTIRRRPSSWIASFDVTRTWLAVTPDAPYAVLGAMSHSLTLYAVLEALHLGCDLSVLTGLSPRRQVDEMRSCGTKVLYATPTQLRLLAHSGASLLPSLEKVFCGGGKLDVATRDEVESLFPNAEIREFFGASETSFVTISDADTPPDTVGRAYPGVSISVRDEQGRETADAGEIWVKSPYLFDGYVDQAGDDTCWRDGCVSIGEIGRLDKLGNLTLLGRKTRMVTIADQNVFPEQIEARLRLIDGVGNCAVIPVPDDLRGHRLVAFVEGVEDARRLDMIRQSCRDCFGTLVTPRDIHFLTTMPMLEAGKPDLHQLVRKLEGRV